MSDCLEFAPGSRGSRGRLKTVVTRVSGDDVVGRSEQFFDSDAHFVVAARFLGVPATVVMRAFDRYSRKGDATYPLDRVGDSIEPSMTYSRRGIKDGKSSAETFDDFFAAVTGARGDQDSVVEWRDERKCCVLDLDFHEGGRPPIDLVVAAGETLAPTPRAWWLSRSSGLHAVYFPIDPMTADELAAAAGIGLLEKFPSGSVELKKSTRPPVGELVMCEPTDELKHLLHAAGSVIDEEAAKEWLAERGMEVGRRYDHEVCPVQPSARAKGNSPPVVVHADHVYCFVCAADGVRRGSRTPGYFPLAKLMRGAEASAFARCVGRFSHWGHARHVVAQLVPNENLAKVAYRAALKRKHGNDPRVPLVFSAAPATGLVRYDGYWAGDSGRPKQYDRTSPVLSALPVAKYVNEDGELVTDSKVVEELSSSDDLSSYGYPALTRVWGLQMTGFQDLPTNKVFIVVRRNGDPKYVPLPGRVPEDAAWATLELAFPGLDRKVLELLCVAKGCSEHRVGLPPMVFLAGPTGAGKTQTVNLAASVCGDTAAKVLFHSDLDRVRRGVLKAKETGSFAFFDEYLKTAKASRVSADDAMELLLSLEPDSVSHVLYVGPVPLGDLPACVWADTMLPPEVASHSQIARRLFLVRLAETKEGWADARELRRMDSKFVAAADSLLSHFVDRWFAPGSGTDFAEVARELGFNLLRDEGESGDKDRLVRRLFSLVCSAPELVGAEKRRWPDRGWVLVNLNDDRNELTECWKWLADARDHGLSRAVSECDLKRVLGLRRPARLETSRSGGRVAIRFVGEGGKCNGEMELVPDGPGVHGFGDSVGVQPPGGG